MSRFFCLWIPHFEAWAVARQQPLLESGSEPEPFVVVARDRVVAACPEALHKGIKAGFTLAKAHSLSPELQVVPLHLPTVQIVWDEVLRTLGDFTPYIESIHPGLLLADAHRPSSLVPLLRQWNAHGGVADDRTTAELAAYTTTSGTLRSVRAGRSAAFLRRVPITVFSQMSVKAETIQRLNWFGWHHVGHLCSLSKRQLQSQFEGGDLLYRYAQADDTRPVGLFRPPPQLHSRITFEEPVREPPEIAPALPFMLENLQERLAGRLAQTITVVVESQLGAHKQSRILHDPTASSRTLCQVAEELLTVLLQPGQAIQCIEVVLGGLTQPTPRQESLFGPSRPGVVEAVRAVERRFPTALQRYVIVDRQAYLPEHFARLEPLTEESLSRSTAASSSKRRGKRNSPLRATEDSISRPSHRTTSRRKKSSSSVLVQS